MATTEILKNPYVANTEKVVPILRSSARGTTQDYEITAGSPKFPVAVFFAPQQDRDEYWGDPLQVTAPAYYAPTSGNAADTIAWDRLNLELMRIANLDNDWDGEGAESIPRAAIDNTQILLNVAKEASMLCASVHREIPSLVPSVEGAVILKWSFEAKELKCTIVGDVVEVVRWGSPDHFESDGFWEVPVNDVSEHFRWLFK